MGKRERERKKMKRGPEEGGNTNSCSLLASHPAGGNIRTWIFFLSFASPPPPPHLHQNNGNPILGRRQNGVVAVGDAFIPTGENIEEVGRASRWSISPEGENRAFKAVETRGVKNSGRDGGGEGGGRKPGENIAFGGGAFFMLSFPPLEEFKRAIL